MYVNLISHALIIVVTTMPPSHQQSTRNSTSQADYDHPSLSSVYFEQWEIRDAAKNHILLASVPSLLAVH
jgi:hypothetical protein